MCHFIFAVLVNRFERPQQINQSKQALSNMLRQRHPLNQMMGPGGHTPQGPGPQANYGAMQRQFPRQPMRQQHPSPMQSSQVLTRFADNCPQSLLFRDHSCRACFNNMATCKIR